ncbi:hypothetical protein KPH14_001837 [Odynerus spinipes]|uniref:Uncharacterized protein n=1 Tax=Odynerus spinipes TaxID=1348599 RepID=A0AAD9S0H1_9HYME|nr:hypothetical protein KPH14_001837 [Odynerus spinipes]
MGNKNSTQPCKSRNDQKSNDDRFSQWEDKTSDKREGCRTKSADSDEGFGRASFHQSLHHFLSAPAQ